MQIAELQRSRLLSGAVGAIADNDPVTSTAPFRVTACQALKFEPKFSASTSGKTSREHGASLSVKLAYPAGALGADANIKQVKVELPKQLPSRLTTLQKACTAAQFDANPAGCPAASVVGHAKALTPILPVALEGPAYFVSHGGEAFPSLEVVLQGDGVKIVLTGNTFISKAGITSSTFKNGARPARHQLRTDTPRGPLLGARAQRQPLQEQTDDAHRTGLWRFVKFGVGRGVGPCCWRGCWVLLAVLVAGCWER